jgi:hypothetical protein
MTQQGVIPQFCDACNGELIPEDQEMELTVRYEYEPISREDSIPIIRRGTLLSSTSGIPELLEDKAFEFYLRVLAVELPCPHCSRIYSFDEEILKGWDSER